MKPTMFIHRTNLESGFLKVSNRLAQDYEIMSATAFGWLVRILTRPQDWRLTLASLVCSHHGRDGIRASFQELRAAGFIVALNRRAQGGGRWATVEYHVFDVPQTPAQIKQIAADQGCEFLPVPVQSSSRPLAAARNPSVSEEVGEFTVDPETDYSGAGYPGDGYPPPGKANSTKTEEKKDRTDKRMIPKGIIPTADAADSIDADSGLNPGDLALLERNQEEDASLSESEPPYVPPAPLAPPAIPRPAPAAELELKCEDEPDGKTFPWRQLMVAVKKIVPEVVMPNRGAARRDHAMKGFWRRHGRTVGCFELLAKLVSESDYLMAHGGHTGNQGRPYSWGWIFSKNEKGELRADEIMNGKYSTERMAFVLKKQAEAAQPKKTKCYLYGSTSSAPSEIDLSEKLDNGSLRYRLCEETKNGLPVYLNRK